MGEVFKRFSLQRATASNIVDALKYRKSSGERLVVSLLNVVKPFTCNDEITVVLLFNEANPRIFN